MKNNFKYKPGNILQYKFSLRDDYFIFYCMVLEIYEDLDCYKVFFITPRSRISIQRTCYIEKYFEKIV